jgi:hypothetical protein
MTTTRCQSDGCEISHCAECGAHMPFNGGDGIIWTTCAGCEQRWNEKTARAILARLDGA